MGTEKARWLHISDLHILLNSPSWKVFQGNLFRFFEEHPEQKPDFVVVTGDYRNIMNFEAFGPAEGFIRELLERLGLDREKDLYLVPGNHDIDILESDPGKPNGVKIRDWPAAELKKLLPDGLSPGAVLSNEEADEWRETCEKEPADYLDRLCNVPRGGGTGKSDENWVHTSALLEGFQAYEAMAKRLIPWYSAVGWGPATPHSREWQGADGLGFNLVHFNTALAADGSRGHYQALELNDSVEVLQKIQNGKPTLILAHNSFYDLHPRIQEYLKPFMSEARVCAWLCGDEHVFREDGRIACRAGGGDYSVPIYVCGKGAPDHGDRDSENGFYLFELEGQALTVRRFSWGAEEGIREAEKQVGRLAVPEEPDPVPEEKKRLLIGYLSCNPDVKFKEKYHLGHAYFIRCMDNLRKSDHIMLLTSSYVFKPNRTYESVKQLDEYAQDMVRRWEDCFNREVPVIDIKQYLQQPIPKGERENQLLAYMSDMEVQLDLNKEWMSFIETWVKTERIEPVAYQGLLKVFEIEDPDALYTQDEVMSFAHLLYKRPTWYSMTWMVNFIYFWNSQLHPLVRDEFHFDIAPENIRIVEARRNHYVWDAVSYCAKRFSFEKFPRVEYIENFLDRDWRLPMKSSDREKAVYLADSKMGGSYKREFKKHVREMFGTGKSPDEICEEFSKRLGLDK